MYCLVWDFSRNAPCFLVRPANHYTIRDHHAGNIVTHANLYTDSSNENEKIYRLAKK